MLFLVADAPKRAFLRAQKCFSGYFSCDTCFIEGIAVKCENSTKVCYPPPRRTCAIRTHDQLDRITSDLASLPQSERKGMLGRSPLFAANNFNVATSIFPEWMHFACSGLIPLFIELNYNVRKKRPNNSGYRRMNSEDLNVELLKVQVPSEFSRRMRKFDFAHWKAQEFRNLSIGFFHLVGTMFGYHRPERQIWYWTVFLLRAHIMDEETYQTLNKAQIRTTIAKWYATWAKTFGQYNCVYNVHCFTHLERYRQFGPLTTTSAFPFECYFGDAKRAIVPGTTSTGKQCVFKTYAMYAHEKHVCEKQLILSCKEPKPDAKVQNNLVYLRNWQIVKLTSMDNDSFVGQVVQKGIYQPVPDLRFDEIGVFCYKKVTDIMVSFTRNEVLGKVMHVQDVLVTLPKSLLLE